MSDTPIDYLKCRGVKPLWVGQATSTGDVSGNFDINLLLDNMFHLTLTGNVTFSVTPASTSGARSGNSFVLLLEQDATGGHTVTWPASFEWDSGTAPTLPTTAGAKHLLTFISFDGGTSWIGIEGPQDIA